MIFKHISYVNDLFYIILLSCSVRLITTSPTDTVVFPVFPTTATVQIECHLLTPTFVLYRPIYSQFSLLRGYVPGEGS
jgi:hypothetical protein